MIQTSRFFFTEFEQKILIAIGEAGTASVKEVHGQLGKTQFIDVMRSIHKLHKRGCLLQKHVDYQAFYKVKPRVSMELRKTTLQ